MSDDDLVRPSPPGAEGQGEDGALPKTAAPQVQNAETKAATGDLLPCPFCGGGTTDIEERPLSRQPRMDGKPSAIISATVRHWCAKSEGQPTGLNISMHGRDRLAAIAAWNRRASQKATSGDPRGEADTLPSAQQEIERLREALKAISELDDDHCKTWFEIASKQIAIANAALQPQAEKERTDG